jgi:hypothetical protein
MTKHCGLGVATIDYTIVLGGHSSQALGHSNPTGKFTVFLSSIISGKA